MDDTPRIHSFTVNYAKQAGRSRRRGQLVNVGFWVHNLPRLMLACRLFGHKPVVDGTEPTGLTGSTYRSPGSRWVCCDRCGVRGEPQGHLNPGRYNIGDRYVGGWDDNPPNPNTAAGLRELKEQYRTYTRPGRIPRNATGVLGGQLVVGGNSYGGVGFEWKVGNGGSEHTLAASVHLGWFGALYLHTERFGTWLQRRLNPTGYQSRVIGLRYERGRLRWKVWARRDESSRSDPWWQHGELDLRILDRVLGPDRFQYVDAAQETQARFVRLPEGDYLVGLKLQQQISGRKRWRKQRSWIVDWSTVGGGIPTKGPGRGRICGGHVDVSDRAVDAGLWPAEAAVRVAACVVGNRVDHRWDPTVVQARPVTAVVR